MIRPIITDIDTLRRPSALVTDDLLARTVTEDLLDTAESLGSKCAGLAAIQIGYPLQICVVNMGDSFRIFVNPLIVARIGGVKAEKEGCLSIPDKTVLKRRHKEVKLSTGEKFKGYTARVIQHEVDHFSGQLI